MELDRIHIVDLSVFGIVGIKADERITPQEILVNATLGVDSTAAAKSDQIGDAANYRTITKQVIELVEGSRFLLIEKLAEEVAGVCLGAPRVESARVTVEKPGAIRFARSAGVTIERRQRG